MTGPGHDPLCPARDRPGPPVIVGTCRPMRAVFELVRRAAATSSNVLITGESGTGKELVARALHRASPVAAGPFLPVNLAAVPRELVESQLFGHERGAFTGAERSRPGALRAAEGGTVFLDEIGEFPLELQAKLLRAIEEKEIFPVGSDRPQWVSVRFLAATHRNLGAMVEAGRFRQDLFYRLDVVRIHIPPLRERSEDIPALVDHFVTLHARALRRAIPLVDPEAMAVLMMHDWQGNVRELGNVLERAVVLGDGLAVRTGDLPEALTRGTSTGPTELEQATRLFQRRHIARVLEQAGGNRQAAAALLGVSESTLYRKLASQGLLPDCDEPPVTG